MMYYYIHFARNPFRILDVLLEWQNSMRGYSGEKKRSSQQLQFGGNKKEGFAQSFKASKRKRSPQISRN